MNRLHHLKQTLPKNLSDNKEYKDLQFIILDYNSEDGLSEYIKTTFFNEINQGRLVFYQTYQPPFFNRSHSRNLVFKLSENQILCNIDADNFTGNNFAYYVNQALNKSSNLFLSAWGENYKADTLGRICVRRKDFIEVGGYNEDIKNYGFEDVNLIYRLKKKGLINQRIDSNYLKYIPHNDYERVENESIHKTLSCILIKHINYIKSELFFLINDGSVLFGAIINEKFNDASVYRAIEQKHVIYEYELEEKIWNKGEWATDGEEINLKVNGKLINLSANKDNTFRCQNDDIYFEVVKKDIRAKAIMFFSEVINRNLVNNNLHKLEGSKEKTLLFKNFNYDNEIWI